MFMHHRHRGKGVVVEQQRGEVGRLGRERSGAHDDGAADAHHASCCWC
jgi:hypothetical protein